MVTLTQQDGHADGERQKSVDVAVLLAQLSVGSSEHGQDEEKRAEHLTAERILSLNIKYTWSVENKRKTKKVLNYISIARLERCELPRQEEAKNMTCLMDRENAHNLPRHRRPMH